MSDFQENPLDYALQLIEEDRCDKEQLLITCLKFMSAQDIRDMLDDNELSPRFDTSSGFDTEGDQFFFSRDEIGPEERNACDHYNERFAYPYVD
jgi:hypothetical protein